MTHPPGKHTARLQDLFRENGWTDDTRLFRGTLPQFLSRREAKPGGPAVGSRISANNDPPETVIDIYGHGHTCMARDAGAGLAFAESADHEWRGAQRKCVSVRLGDVVAQGGRIYPVASSITGRVWFLTLPAGGVDVRDA